MEEESEYDPQYGNIIRSNNTVLKILTFTLSTMGIALSTIALVLLVITAILFVEWRQNYKNQLLIQFMLARFFYTLSRYFYDVNKIFDLYVKQHFFNDLETFVLFYTEMALIAWMVVFTKHMYDSLVKLFDVAHPRLWKVSLATWLTPVFSSIGFSVGFMLRKNPFFFYLVYLILIKFPIIILITTWLILTLKSIINVNQSRPENNLRIIIIMIVMIILFCIQQIVTDSYKLAVAIIFHTTNDWPSILNTGLVIFNILSLYHCAIAIMFWLFGNAQTRKLWKFESKREGQQKCLEKSKM